MPKKIAIIGGAGRMGQWFTRFLKQEGFNVTIAGRDQAKLKATAAQLDVPSETTAAAVSHADAVILSVPIDSFTTVCADIAGNVSKEKVIIDITSVKSMPVNAMHQFLPQAVCLGTHPLFGPGARGVSNLNIVLTPTNEPESKLAAEVRTFLEQRGAAVTLMKPDEHDEMMAAVLGLAHFIALVSADTLAKFGKLSELKAISGITFKALLTLIESVVSEDPSLYAAIQMNLPHLPDMEKRFRILAGQWAETVKNGNRSKFIDNMAGLKQYFEAGDPEFGQAYQKLYRLAGGEKV